MINNDANGQRPGSYAKLIIATSTIILLGIVILSAVSLTPIISGRSKSALVNFDPATYKGATGKILLPYHGDVVVTLQNTGMRANNKMYDLKGTDGEVAAPAGSFKVMNILIPIRKNGRDFGEIYARPRASWISIPRDGSVQLKAGPPYTAKVVVSEASRGKVSLRLTIKDAGRNECIFYGPNYKAPKFKVIDQTGKTVWEGAFQYG